ncbi:pyridine nucleotide-disulfide oxidoreductase [Buttiauxella ferragutiae ATCC 51602]|uniref:Pyridine nucleotide-disulfide oxidoreductase n=1 Tax=Buttiauxella ferragutiae ATCC 51602 TaxID=1354252 RepID=A0ABX2W4A3_9ENTR|nr:MULTISPECIES: 4Fe-4S dicluster domain-containing protein [Buttiauxella]OAT25282.1 pyridine nucleotide-disulfide oxidoreductase [Buttiauxella ferragutiae ATCC 51602]UNK59834.1 4Fe-4S dicluster domain-containing protein [Buttiauxella ferragutiae]
MTQFIHVNPDRCIGCRTCEIACGQAHSDSDFRPRLQVMKLHSSTQPVMCHQCENAPCVAVCPVRALVQDERCVQLNESLCIGCKNCVMACPFGVIDIALTPEKNIQIVKCDLCQQHQSGPECVRVCPTAALEKNDSHSVKQQATLRRRSAALQSVYFSLK